MVPTLQICSSSIAEHLSLLKSMSCRFSERAKRSYFLMKCGLIKVLFLFLKMRGHPDVIFSKLSVLMRDYRPLADGPTLISNTVSYSNNVSSP